MSSNLEKVKSIFKSPGISAVLRWSKCVHVKVVAVCLITVLATVFSLFFTLATKGLVDGAVSSNSDQLVKYALMLVGIILMQHLLSNVRSWLRIHASAELQESLQKMLVHEVLSKEYGGLKGYHSGELVNRVFSDMSVIKNGIMSILPSLIGIVVSFVGAAGILIAMDWHFVILMLAGGALGLALVILFRGPMKARHKRMQEAEGRLHSSVQETFVNIKLVKSSLSEGRQERRIGADQEYLSKEQVRQGMFSFRMNDSMGLVFDFSWLFCMLWGCANIYRGNLTYGSLAAMLQLICANIYRGNLTYGSLAAMLQLIGRIQGPIANSVSIASQLYGVSSSAERLLELTELPAEEEGEVLHSFDEIVMDDITFKYDDGIEEVLQHVNWTIKRGDFMALTGISGGNRGSSAARELDDQEGRLHGADGDLGRRQNIAVPASSRNLQADKGPHAVPGGRPGGAGFEGHAGAVRVCASGKYSVFGNAARQSDDVYGLGDKRGDPGGCGRGVFDGRCGGHRIRRGARREGRGPF